PLVKPESEYPGDLAGSQPQQAEVAGALEQFMDGEVTLEDEVPAVFYLLNRVMTIQRDGLPRRQLPAILLERRSHNPVNLGGVLNISSPNLEIQLTHF